MLLAIAAVSLGGGWAARAPDLEAWVGGVTLDLKGIEFDENVGPAKISAGDFRCKNLALGLIDAAYEPATAAPPPEVGAPAAIKAEIGDVEGECKGELSYRVNSFIKGNGKVVVEVDKTKVEVRLVLSKDERGNPKTFYVDSCDAKINIKKVDIKGAGALGNLVEQVIKVFTSFFEDEVAKFACKQFEGIEVDATPLTDMFETCTGPPIEKKRKPTLASWVDWDDFFANATGPGAKLAMGVNKLRKKGEYGPKEIFGAALDFLDDLNVPLASDKPLELQSFDWSWLDKKPGPVENLTLYLDDTVVTSLSGALADVKPDDLKAYANTPGGAKIAIGGAFPASVAFDGTATLSLSFTIGRDLSSAYISQAMLAPPTLVRADVAASVPGPLAVDVVATGGIEPKITQNGTAVAELGDAVEPDCLLDAVRFQETRFDETAANFTLGPVVLVASSFVPPAVPPPGAEYVLEKDLANSLLPAAVTYVEQEFHPFVECLLDSVIRKEVRSASTKALRKAAGPELTKPHAFEKHHEVCEARPDWSKATGTLDIADAGVVRTAANFIEGIELKKPASSFLKSLQKKSKKQYEPDDITDEFRRRFVESLDSNRVLVISKDAGRIKLNFVDTSFEIRDVHLFDADKTLNELTAFPNGKKSLLDAVTLELIKGRAGYDDAAPLTLGFYVRAKTPWGHADTNITIAMKRIRLKRALIQAFVDKSAFNSLRGEDLGLDEFFSRNGKLTWQCLVSSLQCAKLLDKPGEEVVEITNPDAKPTKLHVGSVGVAAWSNVEGVADLVEQAAKTIVAVGAVVDSEAAGSEAIWQLNDFVFEWLKKMKKKCKKLRPGCLVAPKFDCRGDRPSNTKPDHNSGIGGTAADLVDMVAILCLLLAMVLTFLFINGRRRARHYYRRKAASSTDMVDGQAEFVKDDAAFAIDDDPEDAALRRAATEDASAVVEDASAVVVADPEDASAVVAVRFGSDATESVARSGSADSESNQGPRLVDPPASRPLFLEAPGPLWARVLLVAVLVANIGLLVSSNLALLATVSVKINVWLRDVGRRTYDLDTDEHFSLIDTLRELQQANSYLLFLLILCLSGIWPYVEIFMLLYAYLRPGMRPGGRDALLTYVEMFSKWSFIDIFVLAIFVVAFNVNIKVNVKHTASAALDIFVEMRYAIYAFLFATMVSMGTGQILLRLHRKVHGPGVPVDAKPSRRSNDGAPLALWKHPLRGSPPRFWQKLVAPAAFVTAVLLMWSYLVTVLTIEIGGLAGYVIDLTGNGDSEESYSAPDLFVKLPASSPDDDWRPLVKIFMGFCVIFAFAMPMLHCATVIALWVWPLAPKWQSRLFALTEITLGWSSLDVLLVTFLTAATQLASLTKGFVKGPCREVDGALAAFFEAALEGDTTCFRLTVHVRPGCVLLAVAAVVHMVMGSLVAHNSATIVAERVIGAERAERRASFFEMVSLEERSSEAEAKTLAAKASSRVDDDEAPPSPAEESSPLRTTEM